MGYRQDHERIARETTHAGSCTPTGQEKAAAAVKDTKREGSRTPRRSAKDGAKEGDEPAPNEAKTAHLPKEAQT